MSAAQQKSWDLAAALSIAGFSVSGYEEYQGTSRAIARVAINCWWSGQAGLSARFQFGRPLECIQPCNIYPAAQLININKSGGRLVVSRIWRQDRERKVCVQTTA